VWGWDPMHKEGKDKKEVEVEEASHLPKVGGTGFPDVALLLGSVVGEQS